MNVVRPDGLIELAADMITLARKDYAAGPGIGKHYVSAVVFLEAAGLLEQRRPDSANVEILDIPTHDHHKGETL